jgi:hypothetical protein
MIDLAYSLVIEATDEPDFLFRDPLHGRSLGPGHPPAARRRSYARLRFPQLLAEQIIVV